MFQLKHHPQLRTQIYLKYHRNLQDYYYSSKHVIADNTLTGGYQSVGVDESAYAGIVIAGLEVVERGLSVLCVTTRLFDGCIMTAKIYTM